MKIYIVEDDITIRNELVEMLERYGYRCESSQDFKNILEDIQMKNPDLLLLDINLPYLDGFQICKEIRKNSSMPIIIVTSRNTNLDEYMSLNLGADDFITKPYDAQILLARIQAILKRTKGLLVDSVITYEGLNLYISKSKVSYKNRELELTKNELRILRLLMLNHGNIIPRYEIMNELWQSEEFVDENTLNVNIARLRKKLEDLGLENYIKTKRGQGYMI